MGQLLAKPNISLIDHLRDVVLLGDELARRLGLNERLRMQALLACALHDIGKATSSFQEHMQAARKLEEAKRRSASDADLQQLQRSANAKKARAYPHALASLPFALATEQHLIQQQGWNQAQIYASAAVLTHHSPLGPSLYQGYGTPDFYPQPELCQLIESLWALLEKLKVGPLLSPSRLFSQIKPLLEKSPSSILHDPCISFPDRGQTNVLGIMQQLPVAEFAMVKTVLHLSDWLASANRSQTTALFFLSKGGSRVKAHASSFLKLRQFQREAANAREDVLWLRAPTGTGKTEALLLWAGDADRLLYLLPTQATVNAMRSRLQKVYGHQQVGLAHGRASYMIRQEGDQDSLDLRLFGSVFAQPVTVATLDQYILAHLHGRHWEERRTLARQATIILDEIHAYEPYTLGLLLAALEGERPARLALASATLPQPLVDLFPRGTLVEAEQALWQRARHRLELRDAPLESCIDEVAAAAHAGQKVLVVANTVQQAQHLYRELKGVLGPDALHLLHSRFIFRDRQEKESRIASPMPGTVCVATQVVEVSLDISYDLLFTELAPLDALVQRMGRVNRFGEAPLAPVHIFCRPSDGAQRIYGCDVLDLSLQLLQGLPPVPTDDDLAQATHRLYEKVMSSSEWQEELKAGKDTLGEVQRTLGCYTIDLSDPQMQQRFTARRGYVNVEVLPTQFLEEAYALKESGEGWRLPELLVPVPIYWLKQACESFSPLKDLNCYQTTLPYDSELGLQLEPGIGAASFVLMD